MKNEIRLRVLGILVFITTTTIVSSNKNNQFNSIHRTKEAEIKPNDLYCFNCDMMFDGEDCLNINQTRTKPHNFTHKCSQDENNCLVRRFSYTMYDNNTTTGKKLWNVQRNCSKDCDNSCIIIGERTKLYACQTCCKDSLCNVGSKATAVRSWRGFEGIFLTISGILIVVKRVVR